jgi:hypothetical protein
MDILDFCREIKKIRIFAFWTFWTSRFTRSCAQFVRTPPFDPPIRLEQMSTNLTMSTAGGRIICKQCQATSKRTRLQCQAPAVKGKNVCRTHGGLSTGPKTEQGRQRCAEAKTVHGNENRAKRAERSRKSAELHQLVDLGNAIGLFNETVRLRGRPPKLDR